MRVLIIYFAEYLNSFRVGFRAKVESSARTVTNRQNLDIEINQKRNGINDGCNEWTRHNGRVKANPLGQNRQCASYNLCNYNY